MLPVELKVLLLILIANGTPVMVTYLCGGQGHRPVDSGRVLTDGHRLFGASKTWRGMALALLATLSGALLLELPVWIGLVIGATAMLGDLLSSFIKRRLGLPSSGRALGLDQIPEALLPVLAVADTLGLSGTAIVGIVAGFVVLELALSRILYRIGLRNQPY